MFRFTIRELLLVMTLVAMGIAWAGDHWRLQTKWESAAARAERCEWERRSNALTNAELLGKLDRFVPDWKMRQ